MNPNTVFMMSDRHKFTNFSPYIIIQCTKYGILIYTIMSLMQIYKL